MEDIDCMGGDIVLSRSFTDNEKSDYDNTCTNNSTVVTKPSFESPNSLYHGVNQCCGDQNQLGGMDYAPFRTTQSQSQIPNDRGDGDDISSGVLKTRGSTMRNRNQETIDFLTSTETKPEKKDLITLSGLLNVLDGTLEIPGRVLIMTSNYPKK